MTVSICFILIISSSIFSKIINDLVIFPIENMIIKIEHIIKDPIKAAQDEEKRLLIEEML
jgi:hypothetical protein